MFELTKERVWVKIALLMILLFTLSINIYGIFKYRESLFLGSMEKMNNDDVRYIRTALVLLEKGMLVDSDVNKPTIAEMPGHALILAGIFKIFGYPSGIMVFRIFQAFLQAASIYLLFLISRAVFSDPWIGILACILNAVYIPEIVSTGLILMEVVFKFLLLLLLYISICAVKTRDWRYYAAGGLIWASACLLRPTVSMFPAVVLVLWLIYRYSFREMVKYALIAAVVFSIVMTPWWVRNYLVFDRFIPLALASGNPFLQGTYINYDQSKNFMGYHPSPDAVEMDRIEMQTGIRRLKTYFWQSPLEYIRWYTLGKTWHLWHFPYYWKEVFGIRFNTAAKLHTTLLKLGLLGGAAVFLSAYRRRSAILFLTLGYFTVVHLPYFTFARYAYPVMPVVILLSAVGLKSVGTAAGYQLYKTVRPYVDAFKK